MDTTDPRWARLDQYVSPGKGNYGFCREDWRDLGGRLSLIKKHYEDESAFFDDCLRRMKCFSLLDIEQLLLLKDYSSEEWIILLDTTIASHPSDLSYRERENVDHEEKLVIPKTMGEVKIYDSDIPFHLFDDEKAREEYIEVKEIDVIEEFEIIQESDAVSEAICGEKDYDTQHALALERTLNISIKNRESWPNYRKHRRTYNGIPYTEDPIKEFGNYGRILLWWGNGSPCQRHLLSLRLMISNNKENEIVVKFIHFIIDKIIDGSIKNSKDCHACYNNTTNTILLVRNFFTNIDRSFLTMPLVTKNGIQEKNIELFMEYFDLLLECSQGNKDFEYFKRMVVRRKKDAMSSNESDEGMSLRGTILEESPIHLFDGTVLREAKILVCGKLLWPQLHLSEMGYHRAYFWSRRMMELVIDFRLKSPQDIGQTIGKFGSDYQRFHDRDQISKKFNPVEAMIGQFISSIGSAINAWVFENNESGTPIRADDIHFEMAPYQPRSS